MDKSKIVNPTFQNGLKKLGFSIDDNGLFFTELSCPYEDPQIFFHIEKSKLDFLATAVYLRKQLNGSYKPQVYLYDYTDRDFNSRDQNDLVLIQKKVWSSGEAPLACIFYKTEIKILNCSTHLNSKDYSPEHLVKDLKIVGEAKLQNDLYNENFALKIKSGVFWDEDENKNRFKFQNSAYDKLIDNIKYIVEVFRKKYPKISESFINKIIVQSILIKYLEERIDSNGDKLLTNKYFTRYNKSNSFIEVISKNKLVDLLIDLNKDFNGNVFRWTEKEQSDLKQIDLSNLAALLDTSRTSLRSRQIEIRFLDWHYFEFKYIPVELISRLYEEFLSTEKKEEGIYYTPSHLAQLLVDESIPIKKHAEIDPYNFQILDPACGSGIFLVIAFKRLVQIWRLRNNRRPNPEELKKILLNVYGVDKKEQAISLASFSLSLALCNELDPLVIITKLKFDDLLENNLVVSDFFSTHKHRDKKFDLVIGNPPFVRGGTSEYTDNFWKLENDQIKIPSGQIALKFLCDSIKNLKANGLQCLIIKSTSLLYGSTSNEFKQFLFSKFNVIQIFDFTPLARNNSIWDNSADVAAAAVFIKNEMPDINTNILHLTFRRTKATIERIIFEIDDYDLHFVTRKTAIENKSIWKINLLGGGRLKTLIEKFQDFDTLKGFLINNNCIIQEGHGTLKTRVTNPTYLRNRLDSKTGIVNNKIQFDRIKEIPTQDRKKIKDLLVYHTPNIIVSETVNIEEGKIKVALNDKESFVFKNRYVGIASKSKNLKLLKSVFKNISEFNDLYILQMFVESAQTFINRNTSVLAYDLYSLRYINSENNLITDYDINISNDVIKYLQDFLRIGENSKAIKKIKQSEFESVIDHFGQEFSSILNLVYKNSQNKFRLSDVINFGDAFIATVFKYDRSFKNTIFHQNNSNLNIEGLTDISLSKYFAVNRIIKLYPAKDTIIFIKPNQYRYWLSLIAYRDADKCFSDLSQLGY